MAAPGTLSRKLVVIGDGACGKTCLLIVFAQNKFPESYIPTVFENYAAFLDVGEQRIELALWDTAGQEEFEHIRPLSYGDAHVVLICYSVDNRDSFENIESKWIPEMRHYCPKVPFLIVGCKTDLRSNTELVTKLQAQNIDLVTEYEGTQLATKVKASGYIDCSAKDGVNVKEVFQRAASLTLTVKGGGGCCLLM